MITIVAPDYTRYPNGVDVIANIIGGGYYPSDVQQAAVADSRAELAAQAVAAEFERRVGWEPFLAGATATERVFVATNGGGLLDIDGGLISTPTLTVGGTAYDSTRFQTVPLNALSKGRAITGLQFYSGLYSASSYSFVPQIKVTGRWGRVATVPADVWNACLRLAMVQVMTAGNQDQDIISWGEDGFSEGLDQAGVIDPKTAALALPKEFEKAVERWVRVIC